jgi:uncharacterized alpha-E superfamily protein
MLLSRLAEVAFWLGRYLERAEDLARAILAFEEIRLDMPGQRAPGWQSLAVLAGIDPATAARLDDVSFVRLVILDRRNASSLLGSLHAARENLRRARPLLPAECWHTLNALYLQAAAAEPALPPADVRALLERVVGASREIAGHVAVGMQRDDGYAFLRLGVHLERADMMLRTAGIVAATLMATDRQPPFADVRWMGLLKSVGAYTTYRHRYHARADFKSTLDLLLYEPTFPRSLAHALTKIDHDLGALPARRAVEDALGACLRSGALETRLALDDIVATALASLARLGAAIEEAYFRRAPATSTSAGPARVVQSRAPLVTAEQRATQEAAS